MDLLKPSYATGYAKNASQSAHPNLWDGLVGAWMPSLGVTGETLRDVSGNGNHGTLYDNTHFSTTAKGYALDFDRNGDYAAVPPDDKFAFRVGEFTLLQWVKVRSQADAGYGLLDTLNLGGGGFRANSFVFIWGGSFGSTYNKLIVYSAGHIRGTSDVLPLNTWHLCGVRRKNTGSNGADIIANGQKYPFTLSNDLTTTSNVFGRVSDVGSFWLDGQIASSQIWDRALSDNEIKQLYVDSLAPFRTKKRTVVRVPAAIPAATVVGSIKKPTTIIKPSYQAGYARNASESENPKLWDGLVGAWMPSMGDCGNDLHDLSGRGNHAELDGRITPALLKVIDGERQVVLNGGGDYYRVNNVRDFSPAELTYCYWVTQPVLGGLYCPGGVWRSGKRSWLSQHDNGYPSFFHSNDGSASSSLASSVRLLSNKLTFVAMRYGGGSKQIWQDGVRTALATGTAFNVDLFDSQTEFCIGDFLFYNSSSAFGRNWQGGVSSQLVYNRVLSSQEIKQLYVDSLAPFRKKQRVSVVVPAATPTPSATYHPLRSLAHPLEQ